MDLEKEVKQASTEYAEFLNINLDKKMTPVFEKIDEMLMRLEEYESLINMAQETSKDVVGSTLNPPCLTKIAEECKTGLDALCNQIDSVENAIAVIKAETNRIETAVINAELDLGAKKDNKLISFLKDYRLV